MKESLTRRMAKAVTGTLGLDKLASPLLSEALGCCPTCRLMHPLGKECSSGCEQKTRRIVSNDEKFFEAIPLSLQVIPEDPQDLRTMRLVIGGAGYMMVFIGLLWLLPLELFGVSILVASAVPFGVALMPRFKPPLPTATTTAVLSPASDVPQLLAKEAEAFEGEVVPVDKQVDSFLDGSKCLSCDLRGLNTKGQIVVRARRSCSFQVKLESVVVVRGNVELIAEAKTTSEELPSHEQASLGLKSVDLADVVWQEQLLLAGMRVKVYGIPRKMSVPEIVSYRDKFADVLESDAGTLVEIVSD